LKRISTVITDLDNTLYDWVEIWYRPFKAMLDRLAADSGIPESVLEMDFKEVHQRHGTSEYAFAIEELPSLIERHPAEDLTKRYAAAIEVYRNQRRNVVKLYPGVADSLKRLKSLGCLLIAYTESMEFYTTYRLKKLHLDLLLDYLYSPQDHDLPSGLSRQQIRSYPSEHYRLQNVVQSHTPSGELKPNPRILREIINTVGADLEETLYVGDSLMKDMVMAKAAGVTDVWAKYGVAQNRPAYELLRRVTHWTPVSVEREKTLTEAELSPSFVLEHSFGEILDLFEFTDFRRRS
jgi:FMN phosphatase YigB (HAD superfamily)